MHGAAIRLGHLLFRFRGWTPVPLALLLLVYSNPRISWAVPGVTCIVIGEAIRLHALRFIGGSSRTLRVGGDRLVTGGPFAMIRNPLYLGNFLLTLGICFFSGNRWFLVVPALLFPMQYAPIVLAEEAMLASRFGREYREYKGATPRFVPRRAGRPAGDPDYSLADAFRIDRSAIRAIVFLLAAIMVSSFVRGA